MTMRPGHLGAICYEAETAFGEDASTVSSPIRLPVTSRVDLSGLNWDRVDIPVTRVYANEGWHHTRGPMGGSFKMVVPLFGHGTTAAGAISATVMPTLMGLLLGNSATVANDASSNGGLADGLGSATAPQFDGGSEAFANGSLCRIGALGDARGGGQMFAVDNLAGSVLTLLHDANATPADNDVIYAMEIIHAIEVAGAAAVKGLRFALQTGNMQALCGGCHLQSITIRNLNNGQIPEVEYTIGVSWIKHVALTFPLTATLAKFSPAMVGSGFMQLGDAGSTTRNLISYRDFQLTLTPKMVVDVGPEGGVEGQVITSVKNMGIGAEVSWMVDPEAATATPTHYEDYIREGNSQTWKQLSLTSSLGDGRALGFYFPSLVYKAPAPFQEPDGDANRERVTYMAQANSVQTTLTDLWLSAWRIGIG